MCWRVLSTTDNFLRSGLKDSLLLLAWVLSASLVARAQAPLFFPIEPGKQASLTGNMGELRTNHFHGGLDIRTGYRTGLPVYASAEGYISYIQISSVGYGNMLHIKHPNGLVTVYAHLERFREDLWALAKAEQRSNDAFEIELYPKPGEYKVRRGETIAISGNTGSSGGPHLHYEVRDTNDVVLNPLHFGFSEVKDKLAPYVSGLYVRTFGINSRVNDVYGLQRIPVKYIGAQTYRAQPFTANGFIGLEILARDRINNGTQHTGVTCIELRIDGREVYSVNIERFPFRQTGHINVHIDYELFRQTGERYQKIYLDDGNSMAYGLSTKRRGFIALGDSLQHEYEIICYDAYGNSCRVLGSYTQSPDPLYALAKASAVPKLSYSIRENVMEIGASGPSSLVDSLGVWVGGRYYYLPSRYQVGVRNVYLYDLRLGVPDSFGSASYHERTNMVGAIPSGQIFRAVSKDEWRIDFRLSTLFDTCYLPVKGGPQDGDFEFGRPDQPLFTFLDVRVKFPRPLSPKEAFYLASGGKLKWLRGEVKGDSIRFETKYFGRFRLLKDSTPPLARVVQANRNGFRAIIADNLSGISDFHAYINNKPLALEYDHKRNLVWIDADELDLAGPGKLDFVVRDNCGNEKRLQASIL